MDIVVEMRCRYTVSVGLHQENTALGMLIFVISVVENYAVICSLSSMADVYVALQALSDILYLRDSLLTLAPRMLKY
jgi:hypothetical protein